MPACGATLCARAAIEDQDKRQEPEDWQTDGERDRRGSEFPDRPLFLHLIGHIETVHKSPGSVYGSPKGSKQSRKQAGSEQGPAAQFLHHAIDEPVGAGRQNLPEGLEQRIPEVPGLGQ